MADIYYREETVSSVTTVYIGNDPDVVGSTTKFTPGGAIATNKRVCILGSTFKLPSNCYALFANVTLFIAKEGNVSLEDADTSDVTHMGSMFKGAYLNTLNISK
jgi:hypothetical protein